MVLVSGFRLEGVDTTAGLKAWIQPQARTDELDAHGPRVRVLRKWPDPVVVIAQISRFLHQVTLFCKHSREKN